MITIRNWNDLEQFGIVPLTGEACRLSMRLLVDLTPRGKRLVESMFSAMDLKITFSLPAPWNGSAIRLQEPACEERAASSMLLPIELLRPLAVFCLMDAGCTDIYVSDGHPTTGLQPKDIEQFMLDYGDDAQTVLDANIRMIYGTVTYRPYDGQAMELLNARHIAVPGAVGRTSLTVATRHTHAMTERTV